MFFNKTMEKFDVKEVSFTGLLIHILKTNDWRGENTKTMVGELATRTHSL